MYWRPHSLFSLLCRFRNCAGLADPLRAKQSLVELHWVWKCLPSSTAATFTASSFLCSGFIQLSPPTLLHLHSGGVEGNSCHLLGLELNRWGWVCLHRQETSFGRVPLLTKKGGAPYPVCHPDLGDAPAFPNTTTLFLPSGSGSPVSQAHTSWALMKSAEKNWRHVCTPAL